MKTALGEKTEIWIHDCENDETLPDKQATPKANTQQE